MDLFEKVEKIRQDMDTEIKTSFKWVVLAAVFGLIAVLTFYILVVMAHADALGIAVRDQPILSVGPASLLSLQIDYGSVKFAGLDWG